MMRLMNERNEINVVADQVGSPTYAADLAKAMLNIISSGKWEAGIYHYSNEGRISWHEFALTIKEITGSKAIVHPIETAQYPTPAKRPHYSLLNKAKIKSIYSVKVPEWKESLQTCIAKLQEAP
jgi:dTDP-4-dehydrorhamnose reductase